ncbi:uncharacterized protein LOC130508437 [Raphanus sativus]|uniref:Uncharacterized protein LOC130508437 n=1 Tax=Raphanus sativus TaxID=3726 RepID=A0A9W3D867_RAPSA|nr:uncharacterized protein LOC130508437 [Raphanus sativus]
MEDQYCAVIREERFHFSSFKELAIHALINLRFLGAFREDRDLRKAEVEFAKAENMTEQSDEIYARPKRTWFMIEKEMKLVAKAEKDSAGNPCGNELISADIAEDLVIIYPHNLLPRELTIFRIPYLTRNPMRGKSNKCKYTPVLSLLRKHTTICIIIPGSEILQAGKPEKRKRTRVSNNT